METSGYPVALVDAVTTGGGLPDAGLIELLAAHRYLVDRLPIARRLRPVFGGAGLGPHLHYGEPGASLVDRVRANTAFGLALVVCEHGADRLGRCQAAGCDRVYTDVQRGPRRRYCSRTCQNRSSVAAFRARRTG